MSNEHPLLFETDPDWVKTWQGMPEFKQQDLEPYQSIKVHFADDQDQAEEPTETVPTIADRLAELETVLTANGADRNGEALLTLVRIVLDIHQNKPC